MQQIPCRHGILIRSQNLQVHELVDISTTCLAFPSYMSKPFFPSHYKWQLNALCILLSSFFIVAGLIKDNHLLHYSLFFVILFMIYTLISSNMLMMCFNLTSSIFPLKASHMLLSTTSLLHVNKKNALVHVGGGYFNKSSTLPEPILSILSS